METRAPIRTARSRGLLRRWSSRVAARLRHEEDGVALVLAVMAMSVLALTTSALLLDSVVNQKGAYSSLQGRQAFALAQAALAYAEGTVYTAADRDAVPPTDWQPLPAQPGGGSAQYMMTVDANGTIWTLVARATVGAETRTIQVQAQVPSTKTVTDASLWNYLYADSSAQQGSTTKCESTVAGSVRVTVPIFVRDNLCITGSANVSASSIEIGGNLLMNGSASIGSDDNPVSKLEIAGSPSSTACVDDWHGPFTPGTGYCDGTHPSIYATTVGTAIDLTPGLPSVDFQAAYDAQAAETQTGCPAGLLDNDWTLNDSLGNSYDPFTNTWSGTPVSWDCKVGSNELQWQQTPGSSNGTLTIHGTFFFDGGLRLGGSQHIVYSGQGTLYFTGGAKIGNSSQFCGISNCTTGWDPDTNGIILVAQCWGDATGTTIVSPCVDISGSATAQVGVYSAKNYTLEGSAVNMGPVLADTLTLTGSASTLIPFRKNIPPGTPLATQTDHIPAEPPSNWAG